MSTRSLALALVLSLVPSTALAWPTVDPGGHREPLLGGRWTVALPEDAIPGTLGGDPNAPIARAETDGVVTVNAPDGHFAIHATVLDATRPDDLEAAIRMLPAPCETPSYGPLGDRTDAVTIRCTTPAPDGALRPIVAFVVHADGWVERFETMLETSDPDDTTARDAGIAFAVATLATLHAEDVAPSVERGTIALGQACESGDDHDTFTITLPDGWVALRNEQAGGALLRIMPVVALGSPRPTLAASLEPAGTPPARIPPGMGTLRTSTVLGGPVDWLVVEPDGETQGMRQVAADLSVDCGGGAVFARALRLSAAGPRTSLDQAQHVLESLSLVSTRGHHVTLEVVPSEQPILDESQHAASREESHLWSFAIGGVSLVLLVVALVMRSRAGAAKK